MYDANIANIIKDPCSTNGRAGRGYWDGLGVLICATIQCLTALLRDRFQKGMTYSLACAAIAKEQSHLTSEVRKIRVKAIVAKARALLVGKEQSRLSANKGDVIFKDSMRLSLYCCRADSNI